MGRLTCYMRAPALSVAEVDECSSSYNAQAADNRAFILYQCMSWSLPFSKLVSHHNSPKLTKLTKLMHLEELAVLG